MKKHIRIFASLAALALAMPMLTSCEGDQAVPPMPLPEGLYNQEGEIGKGTWEIPLTSYQARIGTKPTGMTDNVWVTGYIVGWVNSDLGATLKQETAMFTAPSSVKSNVLISDYTPKELEDNFVKKDDSGNVTEDTRWEHCTPVQLVYDTDPRPAINLGDNPGNLGKQLSIMGETNIKYFGVYAVKNTSAFNWGPQGKYIPPAVPGVFKLADTFEADKWYMIVSSGKAARVFDAERSYLGTTEITVSGGSIAVKNINKNSFYFEAAEDGVYRIKQANGLYLCTDGTDIAFHTTDNPTLPACLFTVEPRSEVPGEYTIKAKSNGQQMMFDSEYSSYGLYRTIGNTHSYPSLYIKVK